MIDARSQHAHYFQLWRSMVSAKLRSDVSNNYLSYLWWIFEPALTLAVFFVVFGLLFDRGGPAFVDFLLVGVATWAWFQKSVSNSTMSIMMARSLIMQVYIPKTLPPLVSVGQDTVKQMLVFAILLCYLLIRWEPVSAAWFAFPLLVLVQLLLAAGAAMLAAAVTPVIPDLRFIIGSSLQLLMFGSGIFYAIDDIPEQYRHYFEVNPIALLIGMYRDVLLHDRLPDSGSLLYVASVGLALCLAGFSLLNRFDRTYARLVGE